MTAIDRTTRPKDPAGRILLSAMLVGIVAFALGFIGPMIFSTSNLGPLLGVVTGPIGFVAGAVWAVIRLARNGDAAVTRTLFAALFIIWCVALLFTRGAVSFAASLALPGAVMQAIVILGLGVVLFLEGRRGHATVSARRSGVIAIVAAALILGATLYLPVTQPIGLPPALRSSVAPLPRFAFVLADGFNASHDYPLFIVDVRTLQLEWGVIALLAFARIFMARMLRPARAAS